MVVNKCGGCFDERAMVKAAIVVVVSGESVVGMVVIDEGGI